MSIEQPFDPDEHRRAAMEQGSGFSPDDVAIKMGQRVLSGTTELPRPIKPHARPRPSIHVRGFYEGEKRLSEEYPQAESLSAEQAELNNRWIAQIRNERGDLAIQRITDEVNRRIPLDPDRIAECEVQRERLTTALLRKHFDSKKS